MDGWAVCVNNTTTVCATAVSSKPGTGVAMETLGVVVHARTAISNSTEAQRIGFSFNIFSYFRSTSVIIIPKDRVDPLPYECLSGDFVPDIMSTSRNVSLSGATLAPHASAGENPSSRLEAFLTR
jgi:hypothetical protein